MRRRCLTDKSPFFSYFSCYRDVSICFPSLEHLELFLLFSALFRQSPGFAGCCPCSSGACDASGTRTSRTGTTPVGQQLLVDPCCIARFCQIYTFTKITNSATTRVITTSESFTEPCQVSDFLLDPFHLRFFRLQLGKGPASAEFWCRRLGLGRPPLLGLQRKAGPGAT